MTVHVGEIHTEVTGARRDSGAAQGGAGSPTPAYPGAREDQWRATEALVQRLRERVCARDLDD